MLPFLKNHPFAVEAYFTKSIVITFAVPKEDIIHLIPECVTPDTYNNKWAFVAIAFVQTKGLRPKGFPAFSGNSFFLAGFRIFVRYTNSKGKTLRGLYILQSQTDKYLMQLLGNTFTHYNYTTADFKLTEKDDFISVTSYKASIDVTVQTTAGHLPHSSPFTDWNVARKFAGPLPYTFSYNTKNKEVTIVKGVRDNWKPQPLQVSNCKVKFMENHVFRNAVLANAFILKDIPYEWEKGVVELWKQ